MVHCRNGTLKGEAIEYSSSISLLVSNENVFSMLSCRNAVYWIHTTAGQLKRTLQPGETEKHTTALAHEWWVRDARTDTHPDIYQRHKLSENSCLQKWKIVSDTRRYYSIPLRRCFDLSGHCSLWSNRGECRANPNFMKQQCALTCNFCERDLVDDNETDYETRHDEL